MRKNLSNPYSTGGRGSHFEAHIQASFVTLMLTGGHEPCLPCWPIVEVKPQGKIAGYETDDCIVFVENPSSKERRKLLCQIKNKVEITDCSTPFSEVIRLVYCSGMEDQAEPTEESRSIAGNAFKLLNNWRIPPGTKEDGTFSSNDFSGWLDRVKGICTKSGHLEFALNQIGEVLIQAPSDPDGLWIHRTVAQALNDKGADKMRDGYRIGIYNARGAHWVDPSGKPERELSEGFRKKAEEIENAGFYRFAATLQEISEYYLREAEQIVKNARSTNQ